MPVKQPHFLVIQLARIGDLIQSKRLILSLEREGQVHLALDASLCDLAALVYPQAVLHPLRAHAGNRVMAEVLAVNAAAFGELAGLDFAVVYNLNRNPLALALAGLFAPESVVGYRLERGQSRSSIWCKMAGRWAGRRLSSPLNLVDFWAHFHPQPFAAALTNPPAAPRRAPGAGGGQRLGVALAGRESRRSLPPEYLARVLEALFAARKGPELLLLGSRSEQEAARRLIRLLNLKTAQKVRDLSGKTSLADLHEVVGDLDLLLTPDTGLMHLAAHLGVPVEGFFLSSALAWETGPYGQGHRVWQALRPACSPCLETAACPYKTACLAPFANPAWLAQLSGRPGKTGETRGEITWENAAAKNESLLLGLEPYFAELGINYSTFCGDESAEIKDLRQQKRQIAAEFLHSPFSEQRARIGENLLAELLHETDWMLPA